MAKAAAACKDVMELNVYKLYTTGINTVNTGAFPATIAPPHHDVYSNEDFRMDGRILIHTNHIVHCLMELCHQ